jgi:metallophosphoesterase (TIGR03768 family)
MKLSFKYKQISLVFLIGIIVFALAGCSNNVETTQNQVKGYPIDSNAATSLDRTIMPVPVPSGSPTLLPTDIAKFTQNGYGLWQYGPGLGYEKRLDLMSPAYSPASAINTAGLLNFFTISDMYITDEESPAQAIYFGVKAGMISAYSPVMLYTTQNLDAAVQTVNTLNREKKFDFGMALGDGVNSAGYNELRWYIDVLDGKNIKPDSGIRDDPVPGLLNDYQDEFKAAGLDKSIPWYQTLGNHDHFWTGLFPPDDYLTGAYTGKDILNMGNALSDPLGIKSRGFYMGSVDGSTPYGDVYGAGPVKDFTTAPQVPAADPDRRPVTRKEWMSEFLKTTSNPVGHGFSQSNVDNDLACYSFEPKSNLPIKMIVLDDTQNENDPNNQGTYGHGTLDRERYDWLVKELDKGQAAGQLMIISAHIPVGVQLEDGGLGVLMKWSSSAYVSDTALIAKLNEYPNLIMWIAGHRHQNTVTALKSPDANHPELGFWEVETPSLRDFPQQFRTFEIVRNSDNTISVFIADVDPAVKDGSLAAMSRSQAIATMQIDKDSRAQQYYNAELVKQLSPDMQAKIKNYGTAIRKP